MDIYKSVAAALDKLREGQQSLTEQKVLRSRRVTGDLGEWLASEILGRKVRSACRNREAIRR